MRVKTPRRPGRSRASAQRRGRLRLRRLQHAGRLVHLGQRAMAGPGDGPPDRPADGADPRVPVAPRPGRPSEPPGRRARRHDGPAGARDPIARRRRPGSRQPLGRRLGTPAHVVPGAAVRRLQLRGTFLSLWDDILPAIPEQQWRENLALVAAWLAEFGGQAIAEPPHIQWQSPSTFSVSPMASAPTQYESAVHTPRHTGRRRSHTGHPDDAAAHTGHPDDAASRTGRRDDAASRSGRSRRRRFRHQPIQTTPLGVGTGGSAGVGSALGVDPRRARTGLGARSGSIVTAGDGGRMGWRYRYRCWHNGLARPVADANRIATGGRPRGSAGGAPGSDGPGESQQRRRERPDQRATGGAPGATDRTPIPPRRRRGHRRGRDPSPTPPNGRPDRSGGSIPRQGGEIPIAEFGRRLTPPEEARDPPKQARTRQSIAPDPPRQARTRHRKPGLRKAKG